MDILISGGSGFIGTAFSKFYLREQKPTNTTVNEPTLAQQNNSADDTKDTKDNEVNITWLSRDVSQSHPEYVQMMSYDELQVTQSTFDVVLNLAGAGIADKRWTESRKAELYDSRIGPTQAILDYIARIRKRPKLLLSGSAIGWYGAQGDAPLDERSPAVAKGISSADVHSEFAHQLCDRWEKEAASATAYGVPVIILRTGVVIHPEGGMLGRLITPFKLGAGGQLGNGQQIMSWISREDWVRATWFIINKVFGDSSTIDSESANHKTPKVYNLTAPKPITNAAFTKAVGEWLHRPTVMTMPTWMVKAMFGEMATLLLDGQLVLPQALLDDGFKFKHSTISQALQSDEG